MKRDYYVWVIQAKSRRGWWWPVLSSIRETRRKSIATFTDDFGKQAWVRLRKSGRFRCVKIQLFNCQIF